jgi:PAS domain S-box-containing protein
VSVRDRATEEATAAGSAEFILDDSGIILDIHAVGDNARLALDVSEGEGFSQYLHPDDREFFSLAKYWVANGGATNKAPAINLRWARSNGHFAQVQAQIIAESSETIRVSLRRDEVVVAQRTAAQLRRVVEGSRQGIIVRTSKEVLYMNDAFAHLVGYPSARTLMQEMASLGPNGGIHPEDVPLITERVRRRLAGEETISQYQFRMMHREGGYRWVDTLATLIEWDGQPASLSWMTDITERRAMEQEILKSKEAAEFANRTKTEFLAHMSHELRTPLNAIIGFAEVIKTEMFGPSGIPKYVDYAADIHKSGQHLLDLINDILDLSKLEAGRLDLRESNVSLPAIIDHCATLVRSVAQAGGVALKVDCSPALPELFADERALKQVLLNFLSNAIKFTPEGGQVTARISQTEIGGIRIAISDTGIGMSEAEIAIALSPFGQVDSRLSRKHKGTGLGLPISQSLIQLHGGELTIESAPNMGTTMVATFPASRIVSRAA